MTERLPRKNAAQNPAPTTTHQKFQDYSNGNPGLFCRLSPKLKDKDIKKRVEELYDTEELKKVLDYYKANYANYTRPACWYAANRTYSGLKNVISDNSGIELVKVTGVTSPSGDPDAKQDPWNCIWLKPKKNLPGEAVEGDDAFDYSIVLYAGSSPRGLCIFFMKDLETGYEPDTGIKVSPTVTRWQLWNWVSAYDGS
ncbi:hypothetical protein LLG95_01140 [bacterium]|nr:hypothetical protein [bacterium]